MCASCSHSLIKHIKLANFSRTLIKQIYLYEIHGERRDRGERWGRVLKWEEVVMVDWWKSKITARHDACNPHASFLVGLVVNLDLFFWYSLHGFSRTLRSPALGEAVQEFTAFQPADATLPDHSFIEKTTADEADTRYLRLIHPSVQQALPSDGSPLT